MPLSKTLVFSGALLFFLGLVEGAAVPIFANPRMALSAHLTAVQSGMALMLLGLTWSMASWSPTMERVSSWFNIGGFYALWLGLTVAAATGASEALPIAGRGFRATQSGELVTSILVIGSSAALTLGWLLFLIALARRQKS